MKPWVRKIPYFIVLEPWRCQPTCVWADNAMAHRRGVAPLISRVSPWAIMVPGLRPSRYPVCHAIVNRYRADPQSRYTNESFLLLENVREIYRTIKSSHVTWSVTTWAGVPGWVLCLREGEVPSAPHDSFKNGRVLAVGRAFTPERA